ncbi:MAG TPA: M56 family metallopeptidase [Longimicrobiaceae bacterium]|nr:M56 family metallopeptidase [Longimicrobiaceae bacterium]
MDGRSVGAALASREQRHRRAVLLGIGMLIFLVMSPLFGHHLLPAADQLLVGTDHLGALCLVALHALLAPVHGLFHLLFAGGVLYAVADRARAWSSARRVLSRLDARVPDRGGRVWLAAEAAGLRPDRVRVLDGLPNPAFTVGWARPRVYLAAALADRLTPDQLTAVLAHERAHLERRDPLRISMLRFLTCTLFWIPALRSLADDMADEAEVLADDAAAAGRPLVLASAILALARWMDAAPGLEAAVGFNRRDLLERRVRRLAGEDTPPLTHLTRRSVAGALAALLIVVTSGAVMAHPLPAQTPGRRVEHCRQGQSLAAHLFCLETLRGVLGIGCPHGTAAHQHHTPAGSA